MAARALTQIDGPGTDRPGTGGPGRTAPDGIPAGGDSTAAGLVRLGAVGSLLMLVGSMGAGALPGYDPVSTVPVLRILRSDQAGLRLSMAITYLGVALLCAAWLSLGPAVLAAPARVSAGLLRRAALVWIAPLLFAAPLFSRDLYSYAAQAQIVHAGLDPYSATPADLPGKFLDEVAWRWVDTPAPYGPLWLALSRLVATVTGDHLLIGVFVIRLLCAGGVLLIVWLIPALAARTGGQPQVALWLGALNPVLLFHGVAGGHNDALMVGLAVAGLAIVVAPSARPWLTLAAGCALITAGAAIKIPAVVLLAFALPLWARRHARPVRVSLVRGVALITATAIVVFAVVSAFAGVGLGWIRQINSSVPVVNYLSLPTSLAMLWREMHGVGLGQALDGTVRDFRTGGTVLTIVVLLVLWLASWQRQHAVLVTAAIALTATVALGPSVQPWYYVWPLVVAATTVSRRAPAMWLAFGSLVLALHTLPQGSAITLRLVPLTATVLASAIAVWSVFRERPAVAPAPAATIPAASPAAVTGPDPA